MKRTVIAAAFLLAAAWTAAGAATGDEWYTEGDFTPGRRIELSIRNVLTTDWENCPVVVRRSDLPDQDIPQRYLTVVDPSLPSNPEPTEEQLRAVGGYLIREETGGHYVEYQMDDIDKDGVWDELFFYIDIGARETKTVYLYIGRSERGLYQHKTHAGIGYYGRHMVPFWESENLGWKLWFPASVDLHGKREPMLTAYPEYQLNLAGYYMPYEYGTDMMTVSTTFGAGGICLFEEPAHPDSISRPSYDFNTGVGPLRSPRFSFDVVYNGPLRSAVLVRTMNWSTGRGFYELEQLYAAYAFKSYSTCDVTFTSFLPKSGDVDFGCGIREIMNEDSSWHTDGTAVSLGRDVEIRPPNLDTGYEGLTAEFEGIAMVVRDEFDPDYINLPGKNGNHVFRIPATDDRGFSYMILGGWSQGAVNRTPEEFSAYVETEALRYNNPVRIEVEGVEDK